MLGSWQAGQRHVRQRHARYSGPRRQLVAVPGFGSAHGLVGGAFP